ncbi:MAG: hypothetical protein FWC11_02565 [Firmicutes bacterium]|nr:hypothetical protein [Bacillota bacterium]MCL2255722.1 hypothetical protein [Bacillota bacterium]
MQENQNKELTETIHNDEENIVATNEVGSDTIFASNTEALDAENITNQKKQKKKKAKFVDDGRVIADMSLQGTRHYNPRYSDKPRTERIKITARERWAMFKAAIQVFGPWVAIFFGSIGLVIFLLWLWWGR